MACVDAMGNFPEPPQRRYDTYANRYNPGWKDYPNLSYRVNPWYNQPYQNRFPRPTQDSSSSLETMVNKLPATVFDFQQQTVEFQKKTDESIKKLTTLIEKIKSQENFPSQTEPNPRQNANAVTSRSGKKWNQILVGILIKMPLRKSRRMMNRHERNLHFPQFNLHFQEG
ncbi:hypothetical protein CXB51_031491 [Gossypium anomalum]|uniref:Uncharacterized protein n=1 Tax=Gossypium anomalum TaxID=47600 RepID=A0A8J5Y8G7_9ROSI|nr:hypothetical protein CXB51_031491 [Gossypium anomalum]